MIKLQTSLRLRFLLKYLLWYRLYSVIPSFPLYWMSLCLVSWHLSLRARLCNCNIRAKRKILNTNETKWYKIRPRLKGWFHKIFQPLLPNFIKGLCTSWLKFPLMFLQNNKLEGQAIIFAANGDRIELVSIL